MFERQICSFSVKHVIFIYTVTSTVSWPRIGEKALIAAVRCILTTSTYIPPCMYTCRHVAMYIHIHPVHVCTPEQMEPKEGIENAHKQNLMLIILLYHVIHAHIKQSDMKYHLIKTLSPIFLYKTVPHIETTTKTFWHL